MPIIENTHNASEPSDALTAHSEDIEKLVAYFSEERQNKVIQSKAHLVAQLTDPAFYHQLLVIASALLLTCCVAYLVKRKLSEHIATKPPKFIKPEWAKASLKLIPPVIALFYLAVAKSFADQYENNASSSLTHAFIELTIAYFIAQFILITVQTKPVARLIASVVLLLTFLNVTGFTAITAAYLDAIALNVGSVHLSLLGLFNGVVILVVIIWIATILTRWMEHYFLYKTTLSFTARELIVKFFKVSVYFITIMLTLSAMGIDLTAFAVFGGAVGVGIGLGLQRVTANFISGITLLIEKSIKIGDMIEVSDTIGWVRQLNIRYALVETPDGREILIPNEELVATRVTNWSFSNTKGRIEIAVGVAYGSDLRKVKQLLIDAATEHELCLKDPEPFCCVQAFADSSVNFLLLFWVENVHNGRFGPKSDVMITISEKFEEHGIQIPFPQRVLHQASQGVAPNTDNS